MQIDVIRFSSDEESTNGLIFIDGKFECYCLEDAYHEPKIKGSTRIPAGTYNLGLRTAGRLHESYKKKFPYHKGMIHILEIPNFELVYFHIGNKSEDTAGCPLVGEIQHSNTGNKKGQILSSTIAYQVFYNKIINDVIAGNATARFIDLDKGYFSIIDRIK